MQGDLASLAVDGAGCDAGCSSCNGRHFLLAAQRSEQHLDRWWGDLSADLTTGVCRRVHVDVIAARLHRLELRRVERRFRRPASNVLWVLCETDRNPAGSAGKAVMQVCRRRIVYAAGICMSNEGGGKRVDGDGERTTGSRGDGWYGLVAAQPAQREKYAFGNDLATDLAAGVRRGVDIYVRFAGQNREQL